MQVSNYVHIFYAFSVTFYVPQQNNSVEFIAYKLTFEQHSCKQLYKPLL